MMPPRTAKVGRGFPTFKIRNSIACGYSPGSAPFPPQGKSPHPGQPQAGAGASPPRTGSFAFSVTPDPFGYWILLTGSIYAQAAIGRPLQTSSRNVLKVRCGVDGSPVIPLFTYSCRKNLAPMFCAAERSQL